MEKHLKILGVLFIIHGIFLITFGAIGVLMFMGGALIAGQSHLVAVLITVAVVIAGISVVRGVPEIIAGWGILQRKKWSRILGIIMAALDLLHIPLGTALGIYALWVLFNPESEKLLTS